MLKASSSCLAQERGLPLPPPSSSHAVPTPSLSATCSCRPGRAGSAPRPTVRSVHSARGLPAAPHGRCRPRWNLFLPRAHFPAFLRRGVTLTISPQALPPPASWGVPLAPCLFSVLQSPPPTHGLPPCRLRLFNTHWDSFLPPSPLSLSFAEARVVSCLSISASLLICSLLRSHKGHRLWA